MLKSLILMAVLLFGGALFAALWWSFLDWFTGAYKRGWWWSRW